MKTIGSVLIDSGIVKRVMTQELFRPTDFASDKIVLEANSADVVRDILHISGSQDPRSIAVTCLNMFFTRAHLYAVNTKNGLLPRERVIMLWHSLIWILHIDGVSIITKRNMLSECISLSFVIMRNDVSEPHLLTTEPSEHSNAILRGLRREFTIKDLLYMVSGMDRFWEAIV